MKLFKKISCSLFCLVFIVHLIAIYTQCGPNLSFSQSSSITKDFEMNDEPQSNQTEKDISDDKMVDFLYCYILQNNKPIVFTFEINQKHNFHFSKSTVPFVPFDIQIPPPRV